MTALVWYKPHVTMATSGVGGVGGPCPEGCVCVYVCVCVCVWGDGVGVLERVAVIALWYSGANTQRTQGRRGSSLSARI